MIGVSEKALDHLLDLMESEGLTTDTHYLRVGVKGGGCSGLSYVMDFDNNKTDMDDVFEVNKGLKLIVDRKSLLYLYGTTLTFSDGLNGRGFQWENPNASRTCGCGESFAL
jgi:iron-sulfur cluster assembly protein